MQDCSSNRFAILAPHSNAESQTVPATPHAQDTRKSEIGSPAQVAEVPGSAHVSESGTESVPGIDRRTRTRLSLVWTADIPDPVPVLHQTDALDSHARSSASFERRITGPSNFGSLHDPCIQANSENSWSGT